MNGHVGGSTNTATEQAAAPAFDSGTDVSGSGHKPGGEHPGKDGAVAHSIAHSIALNPPQGHVPNGDCRVTGAGTASGAFRSAAMPLDFRIVTEPVGIQPASALYGVPYDFVDQSAGSALAELMRLSE